MGGEHDLRMRRLRIETDGARLRLLTAFASEGSA
jgi:hypothetical protein